MSEYHKLASKNWRKNNKVHIMKYIKEYNKLHRNEVSKTHLNWTQNNRKKYNSIAKRYRDKIHLLKWQIVFKFLGNKCMKCGLETKYVAVYDVHHIDKSIKEKGRIGKDRMGLRVFEFYIEKNKDNLMLLCSNCHRIEHHGDLVI